MVVPRFNRPGLRYGPRNPIATRAKLALLFIAVSAVGAYFIAMHTSGSKDTAAAVATVAAGTTTTISQSSSRPLRGSIQDRMSTQQQQQGGGTGTGLQPPMSIEAPQIIGGAGINPRDVFGENTDEVGTGGVSGNRYSSRRKGDDDDSEEEGGEVVDQEVVEEAVEDAEQEMDEAEEAAIDKEEEEVLEEVEKEEGIMKKIIKRFVGDVVAEDATEEEIEDAAEEIEGEVAERLESEVAEEIVTEAEAATGEIKGDLEDIAVEDEMDGRLNTKDVVEDVREAKRIGKGLILDRVKLVGQNIKRNMHNEVKSIEKDVIEEKLGMRVSDEDLKQVEKEVKVEEAVEDAEEEIEKVEEEALEKEEEEVSNTLVKEENKMVKTVDRLVDRIVDDGAAPEDVQDMAEEIEEEVAKRIEDEVEDVLIEEAEKVKDEVEETLEDGAVEDEADGNVSAEEGVKDVRSAMDHARQVVRARMGRVGADVKKKIASEVKEIEKEVIAEKLGVEVNDEDMEDVEEEVKEEEENEKELAKVSRGFRRNRAKPNPVFEEAKPERRGRGFRRGRESPAIPSREDTVQLGRHGRHSSHARGN